MENGNGKSCKGRFQEMLAVIDCLKPILYLKMIIRVIGSDVENDLASESDV